MGVEKTRTSWRWVDHTPEWQPTELPIDANGITRPGFVCVHVQEHGRGMCGGNTFPPITDENHGCIVEEATDGR